MRTGYRMALGTVALLLVALAAGYVWLRYQLALAAPDPDRFERYISAPAVSPEYASGPHRPCADRYPLRRAFFGALHVHTSLSGDAASWGNLTRPEDAYAFARGESLSRRLRGQGAAEAAPPIRLRRPLDFAAVTDHAEYLGETHICLTPGSAAHGSMLCKLFRGDLRLPVSETMQPMVRLASFALFKDRSARICGADGMDCIRAATDIWARQQKAAEDAYDKSADCSFTSFVAYEYSLAEEAANLHRNVIFANATVPQTPLSAREAKRPEELWSWLRSTCSDAGTGCDVLAIPHNSNWSSGRMFYPYSLSDHPREEQQRLARLRGEMEPLVEIMQIKGDSECRNGLSRVFGADELCDFEKLRVPSEPAPDCGDGYGRDGMKLDGCLSRFSYARYGLIEGLREQASLGVNSMKFGFIAATDTHIGAPGAVAEDSYPGSTGLDSSPTGRLRDPVEIPGLAKADATRFNPGGIAGIWAEENTRESLFAAMRRREVFGSSGPRIQPRFFAGWNYRDGLCDDPDMLATAYARGVPMGGDLPPSPAPDAAPVFLLSAIMDSAVGATPLQKIQLVKGWTDAQGNQQQRVYDVAGDSAPTMDVDVDSCEQRGTGHASLCAVWRDQDFDPAVSAVYYARVVENPSCRWTTYDCNTFATDRRPAVCASPTLPQTIQERAWTSPVWYTAR